MIWPDEATELSYPQWMAELLHASSATRRGRRWSG
jgi:hypothetical protein